MALGMEALSTVPGTFYVTPQPHLLSLSLTLPSVSVSGAADPQAELPRLPRPGGLLVGSACRRPEDGGR